MGVDEYSGGRLGIAYWNKLVVLDRALQEPRYQDSSRLLFVWPTANFTRLRYHDAEGGAEHVVIDEQVLVVHLGRLPAHFPLDRPHNSTERKELELLRAEILDVLTAMGSESPAAVAGVGNFGWPSHSIVIFYVFGLDPGKFKRCSCSCNILARSSLFIPMSPPATTRSVIA